MTPEEYLRLTRLIEDNHIDVLRKLATLEEMVRKAAGTVIPDPLQLPPVFKDD